MSWTHEYECPEFRLLVPKVRLSQKTGLTFQDCVTHEGDEQQDDVDPFGYLQQGIDEPAM